jgi:hypothetical protein
MNADLRGGPAGPGQPAGGRHGPPPARRSWFPVSAAAGVLLLIAGGVAALVFGGHGTPTRQLAADCGLVNCGVAPVTPVASTSAAPSHVSQTLHHLKAPPAATKRSVPSPSPATTPRAVTPTTAPPHTTAPTTAPPPAPLDVTVVYTPDQQQHFGRSQDEHGFGGQQDFQGQLTIVNHGAGQVAGWTVQLTLPGDQIGFVGNQGGWGGDPFDHWQFSGDTLTLSADSGSETLGPGAVLTVTIHGQGRADSPSGCTFNGTACQS